MKNLKLVEKDFLVHPPTALVAFPAAFFSISWLPNIRSSSFFASDLAFRTFVTFFHPTLQREFLARKFEKFKKSHKEVGKPTKLAVRGVDDQNDFFKFYMITRVQNTS
jgi:hypothetical protein